MACVQRYEESGKQRAGKREEGSTYVALVVDRGTLVVSNAAWIAECANSSGRERKSNRQRCWYMMPMPLACTSRCNGRSSDQRPEQMSAEVRELWASLPRGTETCRALRNIGYG